jgi:predicted ATPase/class 3 adenylate cyclase
VAEGLLPSGTLTFLFTDLERSTHLLHALGDDYGDLLEVHRRIIRDAIAAHDGIEFGTGGDAVFVVFDSPANAIASARRAQQELTAHPWPDGAAFRVRMGVHTGEARVVDGDYVGVPLHVVARLCAAGHGGQVLVSETTKSLVPRADVASLGSHRLRDVPDVMQIYELRGDGLATGFPALRTLSSRPNNLPALTDRMIGRELDVVEVAEALGERRLVTLTGPGGCGKTRLALEAAASVLDQFSDGVWFVSLGAATAADQVEGLTAEVLRVGERGESLGATLRDHLSTRELLLVLDNCEHLIEPVGAFVGRALEECQGVRALTTSREVLGVRGEQVIAVQPLGAREAVELFVERATAGVPGFKAATEDLVAVDEVCRALDGLPLAVELAAARLRTLSIRTIADRLDDRFRLLGGVRTTGDRQRTLEAVVEWSYALLDDMEQAVFRRLALFADSFDLADAEAVGGWGAAEPFDVLGAVTRLVDTSMLVPLRAGDDYRYRMLETLRQYGRTQLQHAGERDVCIAQIKSWARIWTDQLENDMRTPRQDASLTRASRERENLRAVYEWARQDEPELALRIVTFAPIMLMRDRLFAIKELLSRIKDVPVRLHAHALTSCAQFNFGTGRWQDAIVAARRAGELFDSVGDRRLAAWARYFEIFGAWGHVDDDEVRALLRPILSDFAALGEQLGLAYMLWITSQLEPDAGAADELAAEGETVFRAIDSPFGLAHCLEGRALICLRLGETARAAAYLHEAIPIVAEGAEQGCTAHALEAVASLMTHLDQRADAAMLLGAAEELRHRSGHVHRPWELSSRDHAESMLAGDDLETEREAGRTIEFDALIARTTELLNRASVSL